MKYKFIFTKFKFSPSPSSVRTTAESVLTISKGDTVTVYLVPWLCSERHPSPPQGHIQYVQDRDGAATNPAPRGVQTEQTQEQLLWPINHTGWVDSVSLDVGGDPRGHRQTVQTPYRKAPVGFEPWNLPLRGDSSANCSTVPPMKDRHTGGAGVMAGF